MVAIELSYPIPEIEIRILQNEAGIDADTADRLVRLGQAIRKLDHEGLPEVASTRALVSTAMLFKAGLSLREASEAAIARTLTDDPIATSQLLEVVQAYVA
jgi:nitric oxide reductase NorQ protein